MARIGFNAYITLVTLGALNKYINNSKMGIMLMTALTTLTTEAFSRVINGKHITRLTPEEMNPRLLMFAEECPSRTG